MRAVVELAAATLPWAIRARYREEWLHDLEHAAEAGVSPAGIAWGAVRTAVTADRLQAPSHGHAALQATLRLRAGAANLALAMIIATGGGWATGLLLGTVSLASATVVTLVAVHAILGLVELGLAARLLGGSARLAFVLLSGATGLGAVGAAAALVEEWGGMLLVAAMLPLLVGLVIAEGSGVELPRVSTVRRGRGRSIAIAGAVGAAMVAGSVLDATVLRMASTGQWTGTHVEAVLAASAWGAVPLAASIAIALLWVRSTRRAVGAIAYGTLVGVLAAGQATSIGVVLDDTGIATAGSGPSQVVSATLLLLAIEAVAWSRLFSTPLPPASVPLPAGPWHDAALRGHRPATRNGPGVEPGADRARGGT